MRKIVLFLGFFGLICFSCIAQQDGLGTWNIWNMRYIFNEKWSIFGEGQVRSLKFYHHFHYHEYKGGLTYEAYPMLRLTLAAGKYDTYREGGNFIKPKNSDEIRLWTQMVILQRLGVFRIEHRYRTEMRFTTKGYRNRFRYRTEVSMPLGKTSISQRVQLGMSNEIFFTDVPPYFERNRFSLAISYRWSPQVLMQLGYLHQFDYRINDEIGRDFLQIGCYLTLSKKLSSFPISNEQRFSKQGEQSKDNEPTP